ncbi:hypothetical protein B0E52_12570 [Rhodanobacter sp. C06]|nr:hypothetical protein B0E52_12570 [Rhodanobacter sp. C06]
MHPKRHSFPGNWPVPTEFMTELGRMTILWGSLEAGAVVAFGKLAGYDDLLDIRAVITTAHMTFQQRIDVISTLCEHLTPSYPHLGTYGATYELLRSAQKARNKFSHNGLTYDEETGSVQITSATARGSLKLQVEQVHISDVKEACAKIHEAIASLHSLVTGVRRPPIWEHP